MDNTTIAIIIIIMLGSAIAFCRRFELWIEHRNRSRSAIRAWHKRRRYSKQAVAIQQPTASRLIPVKINSKHVEYISL